MRRSWTTWEQHVDHRFDQLEAAMADVTTALTDLAGAVQKIGTNLQDAIVRVNADIADLQAQIAAGNTEALQPRRTRSKPRSPTLVP